MPVATPPVAHVAVSPPARPKETDVLERLLAENAVVMNGVLEVVHELIASHNDLLEIIDGMALELAAVSADLTAGKADRPGPSAELEQSLRQAAALAERAAAILGRSSRDASGPAAPQLRSVAG